MKILLRVLVLMMVAAVANAEQVQDLRGGYALDASVPTQMHKWEHDRKPETRLYIQQPPVIPHKIEGYQIDLKFNKCLSCHSWSNYKVTGATKVSLTHFTDRDGVELANVAERRYSCTLCHVPQTDAQPLVENEFKAIDILRR